MKISCLFILLFIALVNFVHAQFNDNFDDGNFALEPQWQGHPHLFCINDDNVLQLCAENENEAFLFTENKMLNKTEWNFNINLRFSPSANNFLIVWLVADTLIPELISKGYYLKFGEAGQNDAIELYSYSNSEHIKILRGVDANIASSFNKDIKIENDNGKWTLFSKNAENEYYIKENEGFSYFAFQPKYFGLHCVFTSSNSNRFYFDDFLICELNIDTSLPEILNIIYKDIGSLIVEFSKAVINADNKYNYMLNERFQYPNQIINIGNSSRYFLLNFVGFNNEFADRLCVKNIVDYRGNVMIDTCLHVFVHKPEYRDIVINEVMFDVNPAPNLLPAHRYIELFNTKNYVYDISSWQLFSSDKIFELPNKEVFISDYLLLTVNKSDYDVYDGVFNFTSLTIKNLDTLTLFDSQNNLIDRIDYSSQMFFSDEKYSGGWSLELIDPYDKESDYKNWHECINESGGTPLAENSVYQLDIIFGEKPEEGDLLINEILFNSSENTSDYVEVINVSNKIISLRDIDFCVYSESSTKVYSIGYANTLIYPDEIKMFSSNLEGLDVTYPYHNADNFIISKNFPNLNNEEACVGLQNKYGKIIDKLCYNSNMHFVFLKDKKGVSLERISVFRPSEDKSNWHSAAQTYGFGSPGVENSQTILTNNNDFASAIEINPKVFSPNNDGIADVIEICCNFSDPENLVTVIVFNVKGFPVKYLAKNEYIISSECLYWDGVGDNGMTVPQGNYIIVVDMFSSSGRIGKYKKVFSVRY
ncbi:MAG: lamin tail domain-containing protein [Bacteroidales bacterium]|jgi:hypothetical protein|nr:lamin tail domain-containing protein [Bacteroidales bacterium]